jgi:hypothetical protein
MKLRWVGGGKHLNEHLGPLRRYIDSQVGRPWDKVYSEICAHIDRSSAVQDHVRDHVDRYVAVHVVLIDGIPCSGDGGRQHGQPLRPRHGVQWYVCPITGLLRRLTPPSRPKKPRCRKENPPRYIRISDTLQSRFIDGEWYLVTVKPLPRVYWNPGPCVEIDVIFNRPAVEISAADAQRKYGAAVFAVDKRQLKYRELKQYPIPMRWWPVYRRKRRAEGTPAT